MYIVCEIGGRPIESMRNCVGLHFCMSTYVEVDM